MRRQRRQTVLLAVAVSVCHLLLLLAMQWLWQPRSRIERLPVPVFARVLTPQQPQQVLNYGVGAQPAAATAAESESADSGEADGSIAAQPKTTAAKTPAKAETEAAAVPARRRQLWAPLPPDEVPVFRQTRRQPAQQPAVTDAQAAQSQQSQPQHQPRQAVALPTDEQQSDKQIETQAAIATPEADVTAASQAAATAAPITGQSADAESVVLTNPMDAWPPSTRLRYAVGGNYRGKVSGSAQVQWVRQGNRYQSQVDMDFGLIPGVQMVSQGRIFPTGLQPGVFEEKQGVGGWKSVSFNINSITVHNGRTVKNPDQRVGQMLDPAAQFVEFSHRFRTGSLPLKADTVFDFWLGRPEAIYRWQYSISGPMLLELPQYGDVVVHHLKPTPLSLQGRGTAGYVVEMWYAPELQFLPVRIRLNMGTEGYIDLLLNSVEQSAEQAGGG